MILSALIFILGFLCAVFLTILAAPLFWRRAHYLWQKRQEIKLPLSLTAIEADRDLLRATHAVALRKAQMQTADWRAKHSQALLKISADHSELAKLPVLQQELKLSRIEHHQDQQKINALNNELARLQSALHSSLSENQQSQQRNDGLQAHIQGLQQDVAASQSEADRQRRDASELRQQKKQLNHMKSELASQVALLKTSLETEKSRNEALEQKLHRLITELSDVQEKLERQSKASVGQQGNVARLSQQDLNLRDMISDLAAEMVAKTAQQEGEQSPIHALLQNPEAETIAASPNAQKSLAARIKDIS